jgi:hypothetical protein
MNERQRVRFARAGDRAPLLALQRPPRRTFLFLGGQVCVLCDVSVFQSVSWGVTPRRAECKMQNVRCKIGVRGLLPGGHTASPMRGFLPSVGMTCWEKGFPPRRIFDLVGAQNDRLGMDGLCVLCDMVDFQSVNWGVTAHWAPSTPIPQLRTQHSTFKITHCDAAILV